MVPGMREENSFDQLADRCRRDFPLLNQVVDGRQVVYLDSAATSLTPEQVIAEIRRFYTEVGANVHRGKHYLSEQASNDLEEVRGKVARLTGFRSNEVIFTANCTASVNIVATGLRLNREDVVLIPVDSHHSAMLPWLNCAKVIHIPVDATGAVDMERYQRLLFETAPKVVVINHCSNVSGMYAPVHEMARLAKEKGVITVIDAAQSIGHRPVVSEAFDFVVFSAHKMLGPTGLGLLCGRYEHLKALQPATFGGGMVDWVDLDHFVVRKLPYALEAGTPNIAGVYGLGAAIDYLTGIGFDAVAAHDQAFGAALVRETYGRPSLRVLGPDEHADRGGILSLTIDGVHNLKQVAQIMSDAHGVMCRTGHMCAQPFIDQHTADEVLRISGYVYNGSSDIKAVFSALDATLDAIGVGV
ncbi:aminotransferase class V-fold PLP-dependent enzyme [Streptosporangium algeriense]|uniref:Aminotransferase class V-fold PLP-dependent enzyme n=1 Tax=Streptosporangium algeriense TaxID=1682748 RepID=A0ABW3DKZ6_9ACTN